ncbi:unnamed protein product [Adineta ricciae]|uniref:Uncharacterized protein n=1 Tax=Adineta ricciae TaxID=249248 RepID=A0A814PNI7_ADIRI|nr:unnamed protein product [Adineta ricciae]CAF1131799.1 unnamed protein product [Adineta ricciae]
MVMESCSRQCVRRTLYAVMIGTSPIVLCLLLIAIVRLILHQIETNCFRRQKSLDHRRSSSIFHQGGRPTLSYTPVSTTELQRIIQGKPLNALSITAPRPTHDSPLASRFMRSILSRREQSPLSSSTATLANLVIRRDALSTSPITALLAPISTYPTPMVDVVNEKRDKRGCGAVAKHESIDTSTLPSTHTRNRLVDFFDTNNSFDAEQIEYDPFMLLARSRAANVSNVALEDVLDFHSVHSVPYSLYHVN